jgi:hypothetical protein
VTDVDPESVDAGTSGDDPDVVDSESGSDEVVVTSESSFFACDPALGLVEIDVGQCAVLVTPDPAWVEVGAFGGVLALAALGALVVGQLRRS